MPIAAITQALDRGIDAALADERIVGCVVLLAQGGRTLYSRAAGMADREAGRAMTPDIWLRYASVTKPFTTMAALRLMAQGRLSPDDPVTRHLPDFRPALPDGSRPAILLGHSLGGPIAALAAARHPERVHALILLAACVAVVVFAGWRGSRPTDITRGRSRGRASNTVWRPFSSDSVVTRPKGL